MDKSERTAEEIKEESDFVNSFSEKLDEETEQADDDDSASGESDDADDTEHDEDEGSTRSRADDSDDDDAEHDDEGDDDGEEEDEEGEDDDEDSDEEDDDSDEDSDEDEGEEEEEEEEEDSDDSDDAEDDEAEKAAKANKAAASKVAAHVRAELQRHGLKTSLKDLPKEVRPLVQKRLDHMQAAFTRAMQEATDFRKDKVQYETDRKLLADHPALWLGNELAKRPELIEQVQAIIDKFGDPDKKKGIEAELKEARDKALDGIVASHEATERLQQRATEISSYLERASERLGLPTDIVWQVAANAINAKPDDKKNLTEEEMDDILAKTARQLRGHTRREKLSTRREQIRTRAKDRRTSSPAARAGSGTAAPTPTGKKQPKNDNEFIEMMVGKL